MWLDILSVSAKAIAVTQRLADATAADVAPSIKALQASGAARLLQRSIVEERANSLMIYSRGWGRGFRLWSLHDSRKPAGESVISGCQVVPADRRSSHG
jgi:hypothetical protein